MVPDDLEAEGEAALAKLKAAWAFVVAHKAIVCFVAGFVLGLVL